MRRHYILWQFNEDTTAEQIEDAMRHVAALKEMVPGVISIRNGLNLAPRSGGYTHFSFDLGRLDQRREHELVVDVFDPADGPQPRGKQRGSGGIWYTRATGIWRPVWLEAVPSAHIVSFDLRLEPDGVISAEVQTSQPTDVHVTSTAGPLLTDDAQCVARGYLR